MSQQLDFLRTFALSIQEKAVENVLPPEERGSWFSKEGEGSIMLDRDESIAYYAAVSKLLQVYGSNYALSRRAAENHVQNVLFAALDPSGKRQGQVSSRINKAILSVNHDLNLPLSSFKCIVPVRGFVTDGLPLRLGEYRLVCLNSHQIRKAHAGASKKLQSDLKKSASWEKPCMLITVHARDADAAETLALRETRRAMDILNFLSDLVPYNHGWAYLPGEGEEVSSEIAVLGQNQTWHVNHSWRGPLGGFSIKKLRTTPRMTSLLKRIRELLLKQPGNDLAEVLLTGITWAGRATVEPTREKSFLLYAIALETILLPIQSEELGYRLRTRGARLLSKDATKRKQSLRELRDLYQIRSKIVHSGSFEVTDAELSLLRRIAKTALLKILFNKKVRRMRNTRELEEWFESEAGI